jgi:enoyl-CoA hydratase/carnithine racemase
VRLQNAHAYDPSMALPPTPFTRNRMTESNESTADTGHVSYTVSDYVGVIRFCRPKKKNAFTNAMYRQLSTAMTEAESDQSVRAILFVGAGGAFTAGNDLRDFMESPPTDRESPVFAVIQRLIYADKPLIAAVEGAAVGIGTTMLLHCDYVVVAEDAVLQMPFVPLGLTPEAGSSLLLPNLIGLQRASEMLLLGDSFSAQDAHRLGLANRLVETGGAEDAGFAAALAFAARPPEALRAAKRLIREPIRAAMQQTLLDESTTFVQRLASPEAAEAFSAFFERRKPVF